MSVSNLLECIEKHTKQITKYLSAPRGPLGFRVAPFFFCGKNANTQYKCNINRETKKQK